MKSRILVENSTASCFESQKTVNFQHNHSLNVKNVLFKRKTIRTEVNIMLGENFEFNQFKFIFVKLPQKIWMVGDRKEPFSVFSYYII